MSIYTAIENLPENLLTKEIVEAGVKEGHIRLLSVLPKKFVTDEIVNAILDKNMESYHKFDLDNIPENCRTEAVYLKAVKDSNENFRRVPDDMKNEEMLEQLLCGFTDNLHLISDIPAHLWNKELAYKAVKSLYGYSYSSYSRGRYSGSSTRDTDNIKKVQIFLYNIPKEIKNADFYEGLFENTSMSVEDIDLITPKCFKRLNYYQRLAQKDFKLIPESMYTYDMLMIFISEDSRLYLSNLFENEVLKAKYMELMDDAMADMIIRKDPWYFEKLPETFKTETRLLSVISLMEPKHYRSSIIPQEETKLLTAKVCRAFVKKGFAYPKFPQKIWTQNFVDYCMEHSPNDDWFEQMSGQFQTLEIAEKMLEFSPYNASRIKPELISEKRAKELFRHERGDFKQYVPQHFLDSFAQLTGLSEDFFGGEVSFHDLRENRKDFTYCKMGENYIGFYNNGSSWKPDYRLTMTRRNAMKFVPETVFDRYVGTFHQTWFEKLVADCDPNFEKPVVSKNLKEYQTNGYYEIKHVGTENGTDIYENRFLGGAVCFTAKIDGEICCENKKEKILELVNQFEMAC